MSNVIKSTVTINGEDVDNIDAVKLDNIFQEAGYLENGFEEAEFLAINQDGHATFKVLSFDENEGEYIVGLAFVTPGGADFPGVPISTFPEEEYYKALEAYNHVSWTPGRMQEAVKTPADRLQEAKTPGTRYVAKWEEYDRAGGKTKTIRFTAPSDEAALRKVFDNKVLGEDVSALADILEDRGIEENDINLEFLKKYFDELDPSGEDFLVSLEDIYGRKVFDMGLDDDEEEDWDDEDDGTPSDAVGDVIGQAVAALVDEYGWDENEAFNAVHDVSTPEGLDQQIKEAIGNTPYDDDAHCDEVSHIARGLVDLALSKE